MTSRDMIIGDGAPAVNRTDETEAASACWTAYIEAYTAWVRSRTYATQSAMTAAYADFCASYRALIAA